MTTDKMIKAYRLLDIQVLDHIIIGPDRQFYSMRARDNLYILQSFVRDIAKNIPDAEFTGSMEKNNDEIGTEITIEFKMKKGKLEFEEIYPEGYYGYGEYDEEDYDEDEE